MLMVAVEPDNRPDRVARVAPIGQGLRRLVGGPDIRRDRMTGGLVQDLPSSTAFSRASRSLMIA